MSYVNSEGVDLVSAMADGGIGRQLDMAQHGDFGTYPIYEQQLFRQACTKVQIRQSICCSYKQRMGIGEASEQNLDLLPCWICQHGLLH